MTGKNLAGLIWRDDVTPVSARFDDPYFSLDDGLEETRHVFLTGNDLPGRFRAGFHIAELGFGTGLSLAAALIAWRAAEVDGPLTFTSFEAYPMEADAMARALAVFPEALDALAPYLPALANGGVQSGDLHATIHIGDARTCLPAWEGRADAWFLDGFSPAKNPELWGEALMQSVADHTAPGGTFATYTAAGHVRRALAAAGFDVQRLPGYGRKRHMSAGRLT